MTKFEEIMNRFANIKNIMKQFEKALTDLKSVIENI